MCWNGLRLGITFIFFLFFHLVFVYIIMVMFHCMGSKVSFYSGPMFVCNIDFFTNIFNTSYSIAVQEKAVHRQMLVPTQKWQETTQVNLGAKRCECQDDANFEWLDSWLAVWGQCHRSLKSTWAVFPLRTMETAAADLWLTFIPYLYFT